jgi:hypothetical protein
MPRCHRQRRPGVARRIGVCEEERQRRASSTTAQRAAEEIRGSSALRARKSLGAAGGASIPAPAAVPHGYRRPASHVIRGRRLAEC